MCVVGGHFCFGNKEISLTPQNWHLFELLHALQKLKLKKHPDEAQSDDGVNLNKKEYTFEIEKCFENEFVRQEQICNSQKSPLLGP
jgi:hypothetical protein